MKSRGLRRIITDFKRHPWLHAISISTITVSLVIVGGFFLGYRNLEVIAEKTNPGASGTVYLRDALTEAEVGVLKERVLAMPDVQKVGFKGRDSVLRDLQVFLGSAGTELSPGTELFPDILEVELRKDASMDSIIALKTSLAKFPEVAEVDFSEDWLSQYRRIRQFLRIFGVVLLIGMLFGCSFVIANFMGMRHQARKNEIDIVRLMGAHHNFVLTPFLWEGLIEGVIGATLSLSVLFAAKVAFGTLLTSQWSTLLGIKSWLFLSPAQLGMLVAVGMAMAFGGSITVFFRFQDKGFR